MDTFLVISHDLDSGEALFDFVRAGTAVGAEEAVTGLRGRGATVIACLDAKAVESLREHFLAQTDEGWAKDAEELGFLRGKEADRGT